MLANTSSRNLFPSQALLRDFWFHAQGENGENKLLAMNCLAQVLSKLGRDDEAEALFRRTLQGREATLGPHHPVRDALGCAKSEQFAAACFEASRTHVPVSCGLLSSLCRVPAIAPSVITSLLFFLFS